MRYISVKFSPGFIIFSVLFPKKKRKKIVSWIKLAVEERADMLILIIYTKRSKKLIIRIYNMKNNKKTSWPFISTKSV